MALQARVMRWERGSLCMSEQPCERVKAERTIGTGHCMFPKFSLSFAFVHMCNWAGVGKTSLATALAETWLGSRRALVRVDAWPRQISLFFFSIAKLCKAQKIWKALHKLWSHQDCASASSVETASALAAAVRRRPHSVVPRTWRKFPHHLVCLTSFIMAPELVTLGKPFDGSWWQEAGSV